MLPARHRSVGPISPGSTRSTSSRLGSAFDTTAGASTSRPEARVTPTARPSTVRTRATSAPVRTSTPAARAAPSSASTRASGPPRGNAVSPAAPPSFPAASVSSVSVVPADRGPIDEKRTARAATAPRRTSVSRDSSSRSDTDIGSTRRTSRACRGDPSRRTARPRRIPESASAIDGERRSGGVVAATWARKLARARSFRSNAGHASASRADRTRSSSAVRPGSAQSVTDLPSGPGAKALTCGRIVPSPWETSPRCRITDGLSRPVVAASRAAPPARSDRSSTSTRSPARARYPAATRPLCPAPITTTSCSRLLTGRPSGASGTPRARRSGRARP
jgi:hypothetical protein